MPILRPCLNCRTLTAGKSRCETCQAKHDELYDSDYRRLAKIVRDTATVCHICGQGPRPDDPFTADHIRPRDKTSPLAAAHRTCNSRKGNRTEKSHP